MENYFHVDRAGRTCVTSSSNLVTKSQRYGKSRDFQEKLITKRSVVVLNIGNVFVYV